MTIASEVQRIKDNIANTYTALGEKGATIPEVQNSANLADTVATVTGGGGNIVKRGEWIVPPKYLEADELAKTEPFLDTDGVPIVCVLNKKTARNFAVSIYSGMLGIKLPDGRIIDKNTEGYAFLHATHPVHEIELDDSWCDENGDFIIIFYLKYASTSGVHTIDFSSLLYWASVTWSVSDSMFSNGLKDSVTNFIKYFAFGYSCTVNSLFGNAFKNGGMYNLDSFNLVNGAHLESTTGTSNSKFFDTVLDLKYFPSCEELGWNGFTATSLNLGHNSSYYNLPKGLDLSRVTSGFSQDQGRFNLFNNNTGEYYSQSEYTITLHRPIKELYVKIPNLDVAFYPVRYGNTCHWLFTLTKDNWEYIAENAPTVSGKTLYMGASNIEICGGSNGEIIQKLTSKGWTVR